MRIIDDIIEKSLNKEHHKSEFKVLEVMKSKGIQALPDFTVAVQTPDGPSVVTYSVSRKGDRLHVYRQIGAIFAPGVVAVSSVLSVRGSQPIPVSFGRMEVFSQHERHAVFDALVSEKQETGIKGLN